MVRRELLPTALLLGALLCGCVGADSPKASAKKVATGLTAGLPGLVWTKQVSVVEERGGYLDVRFEGSSKTVRLLFPANSTCRELLTPGRTLKYAKEGTFGKVRAEGGRPDAVCHGNGTFELEALRDQGGKGTGLRGPGRPRAPAHYRVLGADEEFSFLHGRFPLTPMVAIPGGVDIEAWIGSSTPCQDVASRNTASMEYRQNGAPLVLLAGREECAIEALAIPPHGR
ncbi:MAG: hypothetical protein QNK03_14775 [Myxococcota bacterium]|nr:hypothetical protein [Myxococcota bacterium]